LHRRVRHVAGCGAAAVFSSSVIEAGTARSGETGMRYHGFGGLAMDPIHQSLRSSPVAVARCSQEAFRKITAVVFGGDGHPVERRSRPALRAAVAGLGCQTQATDDRGAPSTRREQPGRSQSVTTEGDLLGAGRPLVMRSSSAKMSAQGDERLCRRECLTERCASTSR
jgi:hypothetical protein